MAESGAAAAGRWLAVRPQPAVGRLRATPVEKTEPLLPRGGLVPTSGSLVDPLPPEGSNTFGRVSSGFP